MSVDGRLLEGEVIDRPEREPDTASKAEMLLREFVKALRGEIASALSNKSGEELTNE